MRYKEYINLGFKRHDLNDNIIMESTGYTGYYLTYQLNEKAFIELYWNELDNPKLYIKKSNNEDFHIIKITTDQVFDILTKNK